MKAHLIRRNKHYAVKFYNPETRKWSHRSLKTTKKAIADLRFGQFLEERHKKELLGELNVEPVPLQVLAKEFLDYLEANRSEKYRRLVTQFGEMAFGLWLRNADDRDYAPNDPAVRDHEEERQMQDQGHTTRERHRQS